MNKEKILQPTSEYERQLELESLIGNDLSKEERVILNSCLTNDLRSMYLIGLILKEKTLLNIARLLMVSEDPVGNPDYKKMAKEIIVDYDIDDLLYKIADASYQNISQVETLVYDMLFSCEFIE